MRERTESPPTIWRFDNLSQARGLNHFISTRGDGVSAAPYDELNLAFHVGDNPASVVENRKRLAMALELDLGSIVTCRQVHGASVYLATRQDQGGDTDPARVLPEADALITNETDIALMVMQADCVPILLFDPVRQAIGIAHAGWSGTVQRVAAQAIGAMVRHFGTAPADLIAGIGPSIGPCCYEVGDDVADRVRAALPNAEDLLLKHQSPGKAYLDLRRANQNELIQSGVRQAQIQVMGTCTKCRSDLFFSDRAQRPTGRFGAGLMLRAAGDLA